MAASKSAWTTGRFGSFVVSTALANWPCFTVCYLASVVRGESSKLEGLGGFSEVQNFKLHDPCVHEQVFSIGWTSTEPMDSNPSLNCRFLIKDLH